MAISFLDNVTLGNNELQNVVIQLLGSDPTGVAGRLIYNSTSNILKYYNGSGWVSLTADTTLPTASSSTLGGVKLFSDTTQSVTANSVTTTASRTYGVQFNSSDQMVVNVPWTDTTPTIELNFDASDGSSSQVNNNGTMTFSQGTGITTTGNDSGTLTITNSKPFDSLTLASSTGNNSTIANSGTITLAAGAGITTTNNASGTVTIAATGSGSMSNFTLTGDSGTNQTIEDGNTLDIAGGTNITTVVGVTDTVTVNLDDSITLAGELTVSGTGQSSFGGQVTIPGTPVATTDAASKAYVDSSVAGGLNVKGGFNAATGAIATGGNLTSGGSRVAIAIGDYYVVTTAGNFFGNTATPLTPGDSVLVQTAAVAGDSVESDFAVIQSDTDLATASTVGIGNVNVDGAGSKAGLTLSYATGTGTVGVDIANNASTTTAIGEMLFLVYDEGDTATNLSLPIEAVATYVNANTGKQFVGTSSNATTHTFNHSLNSFDVIVQLYDTSTKETVYASVDRTTVDQVVATTASAASLTCLIDKIG